MMKDTEGAQSQGSTPWLAYIRRLWNLWKHRKIEYELCSTCNIPLTQHEKLHFPYQDCDECKKLHPSKHPPGESYEYVNSQGNAFNIGIDQLHLLGQFNRGLLQQQMNTQQMNTQHMNIQQQLGLQQQQLTPQQLSDLADQMRNRYND